MPTNVLLDAIAVTAELTATSLSAPAARVMAEELSRYPEAFVLSALTRCRRELKGRLTIADVITRLDDGRPGPEEAWSMLPRDEYKTVVWTQEMSEAWGVAEPLLDEGDDVAARMAFKEIYTKLIQEARDRHEPVCWTPSLGVDPHGRTSALMDAVEKGRITALSASKLLPYQDATPEMLRILSQLDGPVKMLETPDQPK